MARKLKDFPEDYRRGKYPWKKWCDGSVWEIVEGEDFDIPAEKLRGVLYTRARRTGKKVRVNISGKKVVIQFYDPDENK